MRIGASTVVPFPFARTPTQLRRLGRGEFFLSLVIVWQWGIAVLRVHRCDQGHCLIASVVERLAVWHCIRPSRAVSSDHWRLEVGTSVVDQCTSVSLYTSVSQCIDGRVVGITSERVSLSTSEPVYSYPGQWQWGPIQTPSKHLRRRPGESIAKIFQKFTFLQGELSAFFARLRPPPLSVRLCRKKSLVYCSSP